MLIGVLLVLLGAVAHAAWNLVAARTPGDRTLVVWGFSAAGMLLLLPAAVVVAVWRDVSVTGPLVLASLVSGALHTGYSLLLQRAYASSDLSITYPVSRSVGPALVILVGVVVLDERLSPPAWLGLVLVLGGVVLASTSVPSTGGPAHRGPAVLWGLAIAVVIAGYTLWDAYAVVTLSVDPVIYYACTGLWQFLAVTALVHRRVPAGIRLARTHWRPVVAVGLLIPVSYVLVLIAMTMAPVSVVAALRSVSIVIGAVAAWLWLGEGRGSNRAVGVRRVAGAVVVTIGVVALTVGA